MRAEHGVAACFCTMLREDGRIRPEQVSPSSRWRGLSVFRLGTDDLLAAALRTLTSNRLPKLTGATVRSGPTLLRYAPQRG